MNPNGLKAASQIITELRKLAKNIPLEITICTPAPFIHLVSTSKSKLKSGAQDVSIEKKSGAFTGEVSAEQLKSLGVSYCIVGHSERRERGEVSQTVASKASSLLASNITPVICIGEKDRHEGGEHWQVISHELRASLEGITRSQASKCIIAYEPIWAVGKKAKGVMDPEAINESAIFIKKILAEMFGSKVGAKMRVIYGGSVNSKNAADIASASAISGCLVGRESLNASHFVKIAYAFK